MPISLAGEVPATPLPVQVTLYRGQPVRVDSAALTTDGAQSYAENARNEFFGGTFFLVAGPVLIILSTVPRIVERLGAGRGGIQPR